MTVRAPIVREWLLWCVVACLLFTASCDGILRQRLKEYAKALDLCLSGGRLRELYGREKLPLGLPAAPEGAYAWLGSAPLIPIAHGLGPQLWAGINTRNTFDEGRRRGFRIFEIDVSLTRDGYLVCFHGDSAQQLDEMTHRQYLEMLSGKGIQPLEFSKVVEWAREYPDTRFVLDVKNRFDDAYRVIRKEIGSPVLGKSFIPQVYFFSQLAQFRTDHFFAGEIFTSYVSRMRTQSILQAALRLHVEAITLTRERIDSLPQIPRSVAVFTHPVENPLDAAYLRGRGVRGIYTSYITPNSAPEVFAAWPSDCLPGTRWAGCDFKVPKGR